MRPYCVPYERDEVERLLVALWNDGVVVDETRPDGDMPRAAANPAHLGGTVVALIDVRRAVAGVVDTRGDLEWLFLYYGEGHTFATIAAYAGKSKATVHRRTEELVSRILAYLNGEEI